MFGLRWAFTRLFVGIHDLNCDAIYRERERERERDKPTLSRAELTVLFPHIQRSTANLSRACATKQVGRASVFKAVALCGAAIYL